MLSLEKASYDLNEICKDAISAQENINKIYEDSSENKKSIEKINSDMASYVSTVKDSVNKELKAYKEEAEKYINECEQAFRMTTTKGLSWSFQDKANKLNISIRWWVLALAVSLIIAGGFGYFRFTRLDSLFEKDKISTFQVIIHIFISVFSVGAPLWFSWLATKQIGHRFKLAEDYEYKSSISKAYEGYRREAIQLDDNFSQRLFSNALTRLEEPPIRFVSDETSSPLSEIMNTEAFILMVNKGGHAVDLFMEKAGLMKKGKDDEKKQRDDVNDTQRNESDE